MTAQATEWSDLLRRIIEDVWTQYGPFAALLFVLLLAHLFLFHRMYRHRLADKDAEITRLVASRDQLQEAVLKTRLSSDPKIPVSPAAGKTPQEAPDEHS